MAENHLVLMQRQGRICTLTINRPEHRNALTLHLLGLLQERFRELDDDPEVRVVILRGAGRQAFSSGYDLHSLSQTNGPEFAVLGDTFRNTLACIAASRHLTIAMVFGYCLGGGFSLGTACDLRILADTAKVGLPSVRLGIVYFTEGIQSIVNLIGLAAAKDVLLTGRSFDAREALRMGWANEVVPADELERRTCDIAADAAQGSAAAIAGTKTIIGKIVEQWRLLPTDAAERESPFLASSASEDHREAIQAFTEKRKPRFAGQ